MNQHKITVYVKLDTSVDVMYGSYKNYHYYVKYNDLFYGIGCEVTMTKLKKLIEYVKNGIVTGLIGLPSDGWEKGWTVTL